jgi:hypothetical protein
MAKDSVTLDVLWHFFAEHKVKTRNAKLVGRVFVSNMLSNPFYYGHFRYGGEVHEGKHEAIIAKKLFDDAYAVLKRRYKWSPNGQKKSLEEQSTALSTGRANWLEPFQSWIIAAKNAGEIVVSGSPQERKALAQNVFGSNLVLDCKKPVVLASNRGRPSSKTLRLVEWCA